MTLRLLFPLIVLTVAFLGGCKAVHKAPATETLAKTELVRLQALDSIRSLLNESPVGTEIAIAIINGESITYEGLLKDATAVSGTDNQAALFEIGSITKTFTATLLTMAVKEGKLSLDDPINGYYDFPFNNDTKLTFRSLANHHSGLSRLPPNMSMTNMSNPYAAYDAAKMDDFLQHYLEPGKPTYAYSNLGAGLLGHTLERVYGQSFEELIRQKIAVPYQLLATTTAPDESQTDNIVSGIDGMGNPAHHWQFAALAGAGALYSNVEDLTKLIRAHFNPDNEALALSRAPAIEINEGINIALGWHIIKSPAQNDRYWHNGATGGFTTSIAFDPLTQQGVVVLSNISFFHSAASGIDKLAFGVMDALNSESP